MDQKGLLSVDWNSHKETILGLYCDRHKSLNAVRQLMKEKYDFAPSKQQYEAQFKRWGVRKNLSDREWEHIYHSELKRKASGKDTEWYLQDRLVSREKVKKELSRRFPPTLQPRKTPDRILTLPNGIRHLTPHHSPKPVSAQASISWAPLPELPTPPPGFDDGHSELLDFTSSSKRPCTDSFGSVQLHGFMLAGPRGLSRSPVTELSIKGQIQSSPIMAQDLFDRLPWFQFKNILESSLNTLGPNIHPALTVLGSGLIDTASTQSAIEMHSFSEMLQSDGDDCSVLQPRLFRASHPQKATKKAVDSLAGILDMETSGADDLDYGLMAYVTACFPIRSPFEAQNIFHRVLAQNAMDNTVQRFRIATYFLSNHLWGKSDLNKFVVEIIELEQFDLIFSYLKMKIPTAEIVVEELLYGALRFANLGLVRVLLKLGLRKSFFSGTSGPRFLERLLWSWPPGRTPLTVQQTIPELLRLLISEGLDINSLECRHEISEALRGAASRGYVEIVRVLIEAGADVNSSSTALPGDRCNPLSNAIANGQVEITRMLLKAGASLDRCYIKGMPALAWSWEYARSETHSILRAANSNFFPLTLASILDAAGSGSLELTNFLIPARLNPDSEGFLRRALLYAVENHGLPEVRSLFSVCEDPNTVRDEEGHSLLTLAVKRADLPLFNMLLELGAMVDDDLFATAPQQSGSQFLERRMLDEQAVEKYGPASLVSAAAYANFEAIEYLLTRGVDINAVSHNGMSHPKGLTSTSSTALQSAAHHSQLLRYLIAQGADVNQSSGGKPIAFPLQAAVCCGDYDSVEALLDAGACETHNAHWKDTFSAMQAAATFGHVAIVKLLIRRGFDVNAGANHYLGLISDERRYHMSDITHSPLYEAVLRQDLAIVPMLLDANADVNSVCPHESCQSILQSAVLVGNIELVSLLLKAGANVNGELRGHQPRSPIQAAAATSTTLVSVLLQAGADVNCPPGPKSGRTALQAASSAFPPCMKRIEMLIEAGADINAPACPQYGVTALQGAAIHGYLNIAARLLEMGAFVNAPGARIWGRTAIEGAAEMGRLDMVQLLFNAGATSDPNLPPFQTAISLAEKEGHMVIAKLLRSQSQPHGRTLTYGSQLEDFSLGSGLPSC